MCELVEADGQMPQSCEVGNLLYFAQTVAMKVQHLDVRHVEDYRDNEDYLCMKWLHLKSRITHSDLTEDIGSGHIKENFVIQAQQLGLRLQHRLQVEDFPVEDDVVGRSVVAVCALWSFLILVKHIKRFKACELAGRYIMIDLYLMLK